MEGEAHGKTFKMKGHTLPGINQRSETKNLADGRSKSSAFQDMKTGSYAQSFEKGAAPKQVIPGVTPGVMPGAMPGAIPPTPAPIMKKAPTRMFGIASALGGILGGKSGKSGKFNPLGALGKIF